MADTGPITAPKKSESGNTYVGPTAYDRLRKQYGVNDANFGTYFERVGGDIFFKGDPSTGKLFSSANQVINQNQHTDFAKATQKTDLAVETRSRVADYFKMFGLDPNKPFGDAPKPPSLAQLFLESRETYGINALEEQQASLKAEELAIRQRTRDRMDYEGGKTVALGVISGKQSEIQTQANKELQVNIEAQALISDQLNTKYNMVNTLINFTQMDYSNAAQAYDAAFSRAMQGIDLIRGVQKDILDEQTRQQDAARANLQIIYNSIESGTLKYSDMSSDTRALISKLEIQSGLPVGITSQLKSSKPENEIVSSTTRDAADGSKYADFVMRRPDGSVYVEHVLLGTQKATGGGGGGGGSDAGGEITTDESGGLAFSDKSGKPITGAQYAANNKQNLLSVLQQSKNPNDQEVIANIQSVIDDIRAERYTVAEAYAALQQNMSWLFNGISQSQFRQILGV